MTDAALTVAIRAVLAASAFHGEGHRKVWARLLHTGTGTSYGACSGRCAKMICWQHQPV